MITSRMLLNFEISMFYCLSATQACKAGYANTYYIPISLLIPTEHANLQLI
jgi:hypothetical protein